MKFIVIAYLDPGTLSYFVQILVAALAGVGYAVKISWGRIKIFVAKIFSKSSENDEAVGQGDR